MITNHCVGVQLFILLYSHTADPNDERFLLDEEQYVVWAVGPVGSIDTTPFGSIAVPFKHYSRADRAGQFKGEERERDR